MVSSENKIIFINILIWLYYIHYLFYFLIFYKSKINFYLPEIVNLVSK